MKWIDLPPIWLALCLIFAWGFAQSDFGWQSGGALRWLGWVLVGVGLVLMALTVAAFAKARTTVIPHLAPSALVTTGVMGLSRNPIYLGDALVLLGLSLVWGSPVGLILVPVFMFVIQTRFILPEENRLKLAFPDEFAAYERATRRWI